MFFKTLDKLRKKPEHVRQLIALALSGLITIIILACWIISYPQYLADRLSKDSPLSLTSSLGQLGSKVSTGFSNMRNSMPGFGGDSLPSDDSSGTADEASSVTMPAAGTSDSASAPAPSGYVYTIGSSGVTETPVTDTSASPSSGTVQATPSN